METVGADVPGTTSDDDRRLANFGYTPQLNRVLGLFGNFAVAFTYLSPMVGIYSLFLLGVGTGGPAYLWLTIIPVVGMPECLLNAEWQLNLDEVIVALPEERPERLQEIREMLTRLPVKITFTTGWPVLRPLAGNAAASAAPGGAIANRKRALGF